MQSGQPALAYRFKQSARLRLSKARFYFSLLMALRTKTRSDAANRSGVCCQSQAYIATRQYANTHTVMVAVSAGFICDNEV